MIIIMAGLGLQTEGRKNCTAATLRLRSPPLRQLPQWSFPAPLITAEFVTCHNFSTGVWSPGNQMSVPDAADSATTAALLFADHARGGDQPHLRDRILGVAACWH